MPTTYMSWRVQDGRNILQNKKIKIGITIDRNLYNRIKEDKLKPSRIIEKLVRDYYGNKDL